MKITGNLWMILVSNFPHTENSFYVLPLMRSESTSYSGLGYVLICSGPDQMITVH